MLPRWIPFLAVLPPIVIGWTFVSWLAGWRPPSANAAEDARMMNNASRVLNGKITRLGVVAEMESLLAMQRPSVLVIGNSVANTNISPSVLAKGLGVPEEKVLVFSVPNSVSSHWYAAMEHRIYDDGYDVPLVLVVSPLMAFLAYEPVSEASYEDLMVQLEGSEPVLGRYLDLSHPERRQLIRNRVLVRDLLLNTVRDTSVGFVLGGTPADTAASLNRLFSDENIDNARHNPGADDAFGDKDTTVGLPTAEESLVEPFSQLLQQNGSTMVFVRVPMSQRTPESKRDEVTDAAQAEVASVMSRYGHTLVDLSDVQLPPRSFKNKTHMTSEGATAFTRLVVDEVRPVWRQAKPARRR